MTMLAESSGGEGMGLKVLAIAATLVRQVNHLTPRIMGMTRNIRCASTQQQEFHGTFSFIHSPNFPGQKQLR
jgi:hypothetical protein